MPKLSYDKWFLQVLSPNVYSADMQIGFPPIQESYTSTVTALRPVVVKVSNFLARLIFVLEFWFFLSSFQTFVHVFTVSVRGGTE